MGDSCSTDADCYDAMVNTACKNFICACADGCYLNGDSSYCIKRWWCHFINPSPTHKAMRILLLLLLQWIDLNDVLLQEKFTTVVRWTWIVMLLLPIATVHKMSATVTLVTVLRLTIQLASLVSVLYLHSILILMPVNVVRVKAVIGLL